MSKLVLVANHKGGVGKTMLSWHIAAVGAEMGRRLVVVDTDPQGSLTQWKQRSVKAGRASPNVRRLRASALLERFADREDELHKDFDYVIVDTPPTISRDTVDLIGSLSKDDYVLVPVTPGGLELNALQSILDLAPRNRTRIILNRANNTTGTVQSRKFLDGLGFPLSVVRNAEPFRSATLYGGTVLSEFKTSDAALDIRRLGRELWS